ncbi:MAG TPA: GNAT family N-acetyltransferase [Rhodobiaceae bacterium]|nr:GNAT family N-acetyltransferase [Rhodobiaceae bacterium]
MRLGKQAEPAPSISLPIETPRLIIREFAARDLEAVHAYSALPEVTQFLVWGPNSIAQSKQAIRSFLDDQNDRQRANFDLAVVSRQVTKRGKKPRLIGAVGLKLADQDNRTGEIGYVLHPDFWGQGLALEAARALAHAAFRDLGLQRLVASCDQRNKASARVMEKLGMRREGAFRQSKYIQGAWRDEYLYAVLAEEFGS